mmetsp:Transcript_4357/g.8443  ORF Transcript_4357/g.8443 Transcript_4357/m.8443 type:complete len:82 (+) Transcript_4357:483-728(+)
MAFEGDNPGESYERASFSERTSTGGLTGSLVNVAEDTSAALLNGPIENASGPLTQEDLECPSSNDSLQKVTLSVPPEDPKC